MGAKKTLRKAAKIIEKRGWHQGWFVDDAGECVCTLGAINIASGLSVTGLATDLGREDSLKAARRMDKAVLRMRRHVARSVPVWNDMEGRTKEQVVKALREASRG